MPRQVAIILPRKEGFGPGRAGAVSVVVNQISSRPECAAQDRLVHIVIGGPQEGPLFPDVEYRPVTFRRWLPVSSARLFTWAVGKELQRLQPELIEVHNRVVVALNLARQFPHLPVTLVLHNDLSTQRGFRSPAARFRVLRRLTAVICVSHYIRNRLIEGVPGDVAGRAHVLHNAVDLASVPPVTMPRERLILFAGRVVPDKGADSFVAACALALPRLPGWRAEMIGAHRFGPDSPETAFIRKLQIEATQAGIQMQGYQPREAVLAAMSRAAIVVVPSRIPEAFSMVALEAMACGAALMATDRGGLPELAGNAAVYVDPEDPATIAAAIYDLASQPEWLQEVRQACLERASLFDLPPARDRWIKQRLALIPPAKPPITGTITG